MTPQLIETENKDIDGELDRLIYSAYLLTQDPGLAVSVVMFALEGAESEHSSRPTLLRRTVELSLQQLRRDCLARLDRESSAFETLLYGDGSAAESKRALSFKENLSGNPILLLEYAARVTFVLHHVLNYQIPEAAAMLEMSEKEYRAHLRDSYLQLACLRVPSAAPTHSVVAELRG